MVNSKVDVSFIVPAYNEADNIGYAIEAIGCHFPSSLSYDVIVVDNGSRDNTVSIAKCCGAKTLILPGVSVAELRNAGARASNANIYVFIDADVYLEDGWGVSFGEVYQALMSNNNLITGSTLGIQNYNNWIEREWFAPRVISENVGYINSGHMIIHEALFWKLDGFSTFLETGEDCDICFRAKKIGADIKNMPSLTATHVGYPKTVRQFFVREVWHGAGDYASFRAVLNSKPAILSLANFVMILICIQLGIVSFSVVFASSVYLAFLFSMSLLAAIARYGARSFQSVILQTVLFGFYFTARTVALVNSLKKRLATS